MLVLTRKSNQSIMIGDDIEVSVLSIMGEKVRIGIQAPRDIPVFRKEVYLEIQQENVAAGASARAEVDDALKRALLGVPAQPLLALTVLLDLLEEGLFDLGDALPHPHDGRKISGRAS
jgi:carbon storage regulator